MPSSRLLFVAALCALPGRGASAQITTEITDTAIAGIRLCLPIDSVDALYRQARDTMLFGGASGTRWPRKIVPLRPGEWVYAEASLVDRSRVWTVRTNSPTLATRSGLHVGSSIADVLAAGEHLSVRVLGGVPVIRLAGAGMWVAVDDSSAAAFSRRFTGRGDPARALDRAATITEIRINGRCRRSRTGG